MNEIDEARAMLSMAERDLRALKGMDDAAVFDDEIFGFHVQQAIEKSLKAWIIAIGVEFPFIHNLARLLAILEENGCDVESFWDLVEYTAYAVTFRYDAAEMTDDPLDRSDALEKAQRLYDHVRKIIDTATNG
jgi:HEPN domain-containing protein